MAQKNSLLYKTETAVSMAQFLESHQSFADKLIVKCLSNIHYGKLTLVMPNGICLASSNTNEGPQALVYVYNKDFIKRVFMRGDIGLGETYIDNEWDTPDLMSFLQLCVVNADHMGQFADGNLFQRLIWRFMNVIVRRNSKSGSRKNIISHYDVGNEFYTQWLDQTMTYSSGLYLNETDSLYQSQCQKYQRILDQLPKNTQNILEIGCGWGGFAEYATSQGKKVTGVTISPSQHDYATQRLNGNADIRLCDYRDISGQYDGIVSIEMFEAVGENYWGQYFSKIQQLLKPDGVAVIQTITVRDDLFDDYRKRSDFIRCYTFPGGMLPSVTQFQKVAMCHGLDVKDTFLFGKSYDKTLRAWFDNLNGIKSDIIHKKGADFLKSWQFYLALCAAGFACERINVAQITLTAKT